MKNNYIFLMFAILGLSNSALAQMPNANFTTTIDSSFCGVITVFFHDSSTGSPVLWHWDFGDGASAAIQNPVHDYLYSAGTVTVSLIVIDSAGIADTMSGYNITIPSPGTFSFSPITGCAPLTVTFTASSSHAIYFTWDFGDGIIISDSSSIIQHTYSAPQLVTPILLLTEILPDGSHCTYPAPTAGFIEVGGTTETFDFTLQQDTSQNGIWNIIPNYSNQITSAVWNWGDGSFSTGLYPSHTYAINGWYTICATVSESCGDSATSCHSDSLLLYASNDTVHVNIINPLVTSIDTTSSNIATKLIVYPNPFTEQTTISFNKEIKNATIKVIDVLAKEMKKINFSGTQLILDKGELEAGIYFIQLTDNNNTFINKKIVIK
jgi:PKD repeat protein